MATYLASITLFGLCFRRKQRSLRDYFLASQQIPWWAIALSIVAAETSTLTIISIPGLAYDTNLEFLQLVFGYLIARVVISIIFIPRYFQGRWITVYEFLSERFGQRLRSLTAGLFLITRAGAEGVRVFAISIVVGIALGMGAPTASHDIIAIAIVTALTLIYTFEGGMVAVIWTDVIQMGIYIAGTLIGFFTLLHLVPGGWQTVHATAVAANKLRVLDFTPTFSKTYTFWSGIVGGTFLTCASHGTDQLMVQRLLAARNEFQAKVALLTSGIAILLQFTLFLLLGAALFVFYRQFPPAAPFGGSDRIFPSFIVQQMPHGIAGLLIAAILAAAMSNLSAAVNSLSASTVVDFHQRFIPSRDENSPMRFSRLMTVIWGVILFFLAILSRQGGHVVEVGLAIASVAYGAMLGVFLLGVLTRRANELGAAIGMLCGLALNLYLWLWAAVPFTWYVPFGTAATCILGYLFSILFARRESPRLAGEANA